MKNIEKYLLYICNVGLTVMIIFNIASYGIEEKEISVSSLSLEESRYISYLEIDNIKEKLISEIEEDSVDTNNEEKIEVKEETLTIKEEVKKEETVVVEKETPKEEVKIETETEVKDKVEEHKDVKEEKVIETLVGNLVGYGPDCYGCTSMKTASGKYIGEGNIYYEDATYGKVRIVAGDYSYPFGTIVRISNVDFYNDEPFYAVVLDRGGDIGKNKKFLFDLLFASEKEAYALGREVNIKYEIMRLGY